MNKHSKIYVAGHKGLVGSTIVKNLKKKGYKNLVFATSDNLDLRRQKNVEDFFCKEKPKYVFLCAGKVGGILANNTYKAEFIYDNIMIAANVIDSSYKFGVKKLLNLGSSCIYPKFASQPMKEEYLLTGNLEQTNEAYAIAKISAIKLCQYYNEQYGTNFISVMPTNLYGPNDNFNLETAHVLPTLIRKFHIAKLLKEENYKEIKKDIERYSFGFCLDNKSDLKNKKSIKEMLKKIGITKKYVLLWGSGEPYREFLYVNDFVDVCVFLMEKYDYKHIGEFINIGTGEDLKIKELAEIIKSVIGFDGEIKYDSSKPDGTPKKLLDVSKIKKLGWIPKIKIDEGIRDVYQSYLNSVDK